MGQKKRGLGKGLSDLGLSELLGGAATADVAVAHAPAAETLLDMPEANRPSDSLQFLPIDKISPGRYQPRQHFDTDTLQELAQSIRSQGVIQPIVVRRMNDRYELVAGERRWRAAQLAELSEIPTIVKDLPDESVVAMSLIENIQRQDLNVIEEATALSRLLDEFQLTHQAVADAVGKSRTAVTNLLRLLKLNPDVRMMVERGELEMGHARALLALEGAAQTDVAKTIMKRSMSVRQTEEWVRRLLQTKNAAVVAAPTVDPNIKTLQNNLSDKLCARVLIRHQSKGNGQLVIHYNSVDELDGILEHIQ